ncbi:hypothetical protein D3C72_2493860 [compost metagenome]
MGMGGLASRAKPDQSQAALSAAFWVSKAQVSQGISAFMSAVSIVAPAQILRPDGASR